MYLIAGNFGRVKFLAIGRTNLWPYSIKHAHNGSKR